MAEMGNSAGFGKNFLSLLGQGSSFNTAYNIAQVALTWYIFTLLIPHSAAMPSMKYRLKLL